MHNIYLFQPQYTVTFGGTEQYWLPYSVGCIWAYVQQFSEVTDICYLKDIFFKREPIDQVLDKIQDPVICAFSCYVWNEKYSLKVAEKIKKKWPKCYIVFGGPQVSGDYTRYKFIDSIILKEGENSFLEILKTISADKTPELFYHLPRIENLEDIPSPYFSGVFDNIIKENPDVYWSTVIETNRGCPYSCTFCDWGGLVSSKVKKFNVSRIEQDLNWMKNKKIRTLFIADANFGIFKERDCEIAKKIGTFVKNSSVEFISLNYTKNSNKEIFEIAKLLGQVNKGLTFSVQSMNPDTLEVIKRTNMSSNNITELIKLSNQYNIPSYTEIILGLPLETLESWKQGIGNILEMGQHNRIEPQLAMILRNTEMFTVQKKLYQLDTVEVKNFVPFGNDKETGIVETADIVRSTSTMTTTELIESWMYSWTVLHLHCSGYSQLLAKYCRFIHDISYRKFYDTLFEKIQQRYSPINTEFKKIKTALTNMYQFGDTLDSNIQPSNIQFTSLYYFYHNIEHAVNLGIETAKELVPVDNSIIEIQKRYIQNNIWITPYTVNSTVDIIDWQPIPTTYQIFNHVETFKDTYENFFVNHRRYGNLKNIIQKC